MTVTREEREWVVRSLRGIKNWGAAPLKAADLIEELQREYERVREISGFSDNEARQLLAAKEDLRVLRGVVSTASDLATLLDSDCIDVPPGGGRCDECIGCYTHAVRGVLDHALKEHA